MDASFASASAGKTHESKEEIPERPERILVQPLWFEVFSRKLASGFCAEVGYAPGSPPPIVKPSRWNEAQRPRIPVSPPLPGFEASA